MKRSMITKIITYIIIIVGIACYKSFNLNESIGNYIVNILNKICIRNVIIEDASTKTKLVIEKILSKHTTQSRTNIDIRKIYNQITDIPWVSKLEIREKFPNHYVIRIKESTPYAAYYKNKKIYLISKAGKILEEAKNSSGNVIVSGENANVKAASIIDELSKYQGLLGNVSEIKLRNNRRWDIVMGNTIILLPEININEAIELFYDIFYKTDIYTKFSKIDFRIIGRVITSSRVTR